MDLEEIQDLGTYWRSAALLVLLAKLDRPAGESEIAALLGIDRNTVRNHLRSLTEGGLVIRRHNHNGYALTRPGWQSIHNENAQFAPNSMKFTPKLARTARFGGSTTSSAFNRRKIENREAAVEEEAENAQITPFLMKASPIWMNTTRFRRRWRFSTFWFKRRRLSGAREAELLSALQAANLAALRAEGLGSNHRVQRICRLPHVTPEYIAGQARRLRQEHRFAATLLLHIVESGDPLPRNDGDRDDQDAEDRQRYVRGAYADIIEH